MALGYAYLSTEDERVEVWAAMLARGPLTDLRSSPMARAQPRAEDVETHHHFTLRKGNYYGL